MIRPVSRNGHELYLRPLRASDTDRLLAFFVSLSPESRRLFRPHAFTRDDALRACREAEGERSTRLVVIRPRGEAIVGYGYFTEAGVADPRVPILGIAVSDRYQNVGLGRELMQALIEEARGLGKDGLQLTVYKENARAIHLYARLGFQMVGEADGGKQHAMRLAFVPDHTVYDQRGIFLNPVPCGLTHLTMDTWTAEEWRSYLDFLHAAGANLVKIRVWPSQYYHPDVPATLPNAWRWGVLREALQHARGLGMRAYVGFLLNGVPPSIWHACHSLRAAELGYRGLGLCWSRGRAEILPFPSFLFDSLGDCADGFVLSVAGPALCACPECRDHGRVVRTAVDTYASLLNGRAALCLNLAGSEQARQRAGPRSPGTDIPALPDGGFALLPPEEECLRASLAAAGCPVLAYGPHLDADGTADAPAPLPRPRLRQVDRLVAQNKGVAGIVGQRITPYTQFVTDYVLLQKLLFPARAHHEILRDLGGRLFARTEYVFGFARAAWALDCWWEDGRHGDLSDARDGLGALPDDPFGLVRPLRDSVQLLFDLVRHLEEGEHHFDALVARLHGRLAESPLFQGLTLDLVWQARAADRLAERVSQWLDVLRQHQGRGAP